MALASAELLLKQQQQGVGETGTFNASTNVPYAVVNLANDRQHLPAFPNLQEEIHDGTVTHPINIAEDTAVPQKSGGFFSQFRPHSAASSTSSRRPKPSGDDNSMQMLSHVLRLPSGDSGLRGSSARGNRAASRRSSRMSETMFGADKDESEDTMEPNELARAYKNWVESHFSMHNACVYPCPDPRNKSKCACGRDFAIWGPHAHPKSGNPKQWSLDTSCTHVPTTSYGLVIFKDPPSVDADDLLREHINVGRPYIRVSQTDCLEAPQMVRDLLVSKWDLDPPRVLLAITGGAAAFGLPPKLDRMIRIGLAKAASSQSMWITTGGTNSGVMKYVAEAISDSGSYVPVIGMTSWSVVRNKPALETYRDGHPTAGGLTYYGDPDSHFPMPFCSLDRNHTHFILVDDGTVDKFGGEIAARAAIEASVAELMSYGVFGSESPISTVLLAIQGGPGTVQTILESLKKQTPVVIVNGSGKTCNAIAYAYHLPEPGERADSTGYTLAGLDEMIMNEFAVHSKSPTFQKIRQACLECVEPQYKKLIHIYTVDYSGEGSDVSLDVAILQAVLDHDGRQWEEWSKRQDIDDNDSAAVVQARTRKRDLSRVLRLEMALMWNRISVVKEEVSQYCVLPSLSKIEQTLTYTVLERGAKVYRSHLNSDVMLSKGDKVVLKQIKQSKWLVSFKGKSDKVAHDIWVNGSHLAKPGNTFADTVILAQLQMLEYLLLNEALDFVKLFLQGMRPHDVHAFLSVSLQELWKQAANYEFKKTNNSNDTGGDAEAASPTKDSGVTVQYLKTVKQRRTRGSMRRRLAELHDTQVSPSTTQGPGSESRLFEPSRVTNGLLQLPTDSAMARVPSPALSDMSNAALDEASKSLLLKVQSFDDSDVHLPAYIDMRFFKAAAEAQLKCWVQKKKNQRVAGFTLSAHSLHIVQKFDSDRNPSLRLLEPREMLRRLEWGVWFLKFLFNHGYVVSVHARTQQSDSGDKLANVDAHLVLVEMLAETLHSKWLQKKVEDHWVYGEQYSDTPPNQSSPFLTLFDDLPAASRDHCLAYARSLLETVLAKGLWIWRPDMLELLYFKSMDSKATLARRLPGGALWRSEIHNMVADVIGGGYTKDFSTYNALDPFHHLMTWAVVTQRFELATFFWSMRPQDSLINAIVGALLCTMIQRDRFMTPEQKSDFEEYAKVLRENALGVLTECISRDSTQTRRLLKAQYANAGWMTLWEAAYLLKDSRITSQPLFIEVIWDEWLGILERPVGFFKMCLGIVLPIPYLTLYSTAHDGREGTKNSSEWRKFRLRGIGALAKVIGAVSLRMDDSVLHNVTAPSITFAGSHNPVELSTPTAGATIYYTTDGSDPRLEGTRFVPRKRISGVSSSKSLKKTDGDASTLSADSSATVSAGDTPSVIRLTEKRIYTIKAYAEAPGFSDSATTVKEIDMQQICKITGDVPHFVFGPRNSMANWISTGWFGISLYRIKGFYDAPYTTFITFLLTSLTYTILYSYASIVTTKPLAEVARLGSTEDIIVAVVLAWTLTYIVDELRQLVMLGWGEWWGGQGGGWNKVDALIYLNVTLSVLLRLSDDSSLLRLSRITFALGALILWLRLSRLYALSKALGPKLVMILTMMMDVMVFLALLALVLIGYGVAMHAILQPYRSFDEGSIMTIFVKPIFNAIGDTFVEEIQSHTQCLGEDFTQCDDWSAYLVLVLLIMYLIISNILLVNLLIAMMANTYQQLEDRSIDIWSIQNIDLLEEFRELLPLPPPLNLVYNIFDVLFASLRYATGNARGRNKVGPDGAQVQTCVVDSQQRLTKSNSTFLEAQTLRFQQKQLSADKTTAMQVTLEALIDKRLNHVDNKIKDLEFSMSSLSATLREVAATLRPRAHLPAGDSGV
eukprot:m.586302 g.586302  ORF g.586302 m.586302 type:complete len:1876 (+) comp22342_c1_seq4:279-5906(+)